MSARQPYKSRIATNIGAEYVDRYFNTLWNNKLGQLTSGNVRQMRKSPIGDNKGQPVHSDLQPHGFHKFMGSDSWSLCIAVPSDSIHARNMEDCDKASLMVGHTDPQLFHWYKQLGCLPPRALVSGRAELLTGDLKNEVWDGMFSKHVHIHEIARQKWESNDSKTKEEEVELSKRKRMEDEKTMKRMTSGDWRGKFKDKERNPTPEEDRELPVYVMKPETFSVIRIRPDVQLWTSYSGGMKKVYETIPDRDPLSLSSRRFVAQMNVYRERLVACLNMSYNLKLANAFVLSVDCKGFYAMACEERNVTPGVEEGPREQWQEYRFNFGFDEKPFSHPQEMEWWLRGFVNSAQPDKPMNELNQADKEDDDTYHERYT